MRASWSWSLVLVLAACSGDDTSSSTHPLPDCGVSCGGDAALAADRVMMDFGSVAVSSTSPLATVRIANNGSSQSGSISALATGPSAAEFIVTNGCTTLSGGGTCVVTVSLKPTTAGAKTGSLVVTSSPGGTIMVALTGAATN